MYYIFIDEINLTAIVGIKGVAINCFATELPAGSE